MSFHQKPDVHNAWLIFLRCYFEIMISSETWLIVSRKKVNFGTVSKLHAKWPKELIVLFCFFLRDPVVH